MRDTTHADCCTSIIFFHWAMNTADTAYRNKPELIGRKQH
jgi:hypothetical protein